MVFQVNRQSTESGSPGYKGHDERGSLLAELCQSLGIPNMYLCLRKYIVLRGSSDGWAWHYSGWTKVQPEDHKLRVLLCSSCCCSRFLEISAPSTQRHEKDNARFQVASKEDLYMKGDPKQELHEGEHLSELRHYLARSPSWVVRKLGFVVA